MFFNLCNAQNNYYDSNSSCKKYYKDESELTLTPSKKVFLPRTEGNEFAALLSLLPTAVDLGFKITANILENNKKKYSGEYSIQRGFIEAGKQFAANENKRTVPDIVFTRKLILSKGGEPTLAMSMEIKAETMEGIDGFYYYVDKMITTLSKAKTKNTTTLDYTIEIKPTFLVNGEKKAQELSPITITGVEMDNAQAFTANKFRTEFIPLPRNGYLVDIALKIVETNPNKIKAEKLLENFNGYKDEAKTIINNFLPTKEKESEDKKEVADPNKPVKSK